MNTVHQNDLVDTAFHDLNDWISHGGHGNAPPAFPRIQVVGSGATASYAKDPLGNTLGSVRLPQLQSYLYDESPLSCPRADVRRQAETQRHGSLGTLVP
jgi:hypothetical protein